MSKQVMSKTKLAGNQECKVLYHQAKDMVELEVGDTSLKLAAANFFMVNEMMRKAAAKLVMQTELQQLLANEASEAGNVMLSTDFLIREAKVFKMLAMPA